MECLESTDSLTDVDIKDIKTILPLYTKQALMRLFTPYNIEHYRLVDTFNSLADSFHLENSKDLGSLLNSLLKNPDFPGDFVEAVDFIRKLRNSVRKVIHFFKN